MQITREANSVMTEQEIFDKVVRHLIAQGEQAVDPATGRCQYRAPGGLKCAIGCLIPDELYEPEMDGEMALSASDVLESYPELAGAIGSYSEALGDMLNSLQRVHDISNDYLHRGGLTFYGVAKLRGIARTYALSPAVLNEVPT